MLAVSLITLIGYAILSGVTGVRLLMLAARSRQLPETALGVLYIVGGMLGWALLLAGGTLVSKSPSFAHAGQYMEYVGLLCLSAGTLSAALFSWRVFSPDSGWQRGLFVALAAVLAADYLRNVVLTGAVIPPVTTFWFWPGALGRSFPFVWMAVAGMRYATLLHKRLALGLADPIVANRVALWGYAGLTGTLSAVIATGASCLDLWVTHGPEVFLATSVCGFVGAALGWLAFVPPARYLAWVEARAPKVVE